MESRLSKTECERVIKFCNLHMEGAWKNADATCVDVCQLSGGMSNMLYRCSLLDQDQQATDDEPSEVLLRLYGPAKCDLDQQLEIFNILAARNLGPRLYAAFDDGRIEQYLPSGALTWAKMTKDDVSAAVAKKIAIIHQLEIGCLDKNAHWLMDEINRINDFLQTHIDKSSQVPMCEGARATTLTIAKDMLRVDFQAEIDFVAKLIQSSKSPLVFSHNDLHQNNILELHEAMSAAAAGSDDITTTTIDDRIVLIDFEFSSYNYRAFDLANHLSEWCFDYAGDAYPFFSASFERFPSDKSQKQFLASYIEQMTDGHHHRNNGHMNGTTDKTQQLFDEIQPFFLASNLLWSVWAVRSAYTSKINFGYWEMAKWKWDIYEFCKQRLLKRQQEWPAEQLTRRLAKM